MPGFWVDFAGWGGRVGMGLDSDGGGEVIVGGDEDVYLVNG